MRGHAGKFCLVAKKFNKKLSLKILSASLRHEIVCQEAALHKSREFPHSLSLLNGNYHLKEEKKTETVVIKSLDLYSLVQIKLTIKLTKLII